MLAGCYRWLAWNRRLAPHDRASAVVHNLQRLIAANAHVTTRRDAQGRLPLYYAAKHGADAVVLQTLCTAVFFPPSAACDEDVFTMV
jgi:hypothetical protein